MLLKMEGRGGIIGRAIHQHFLQAEHTLRTFHIVELEAVVDGFQQLVGIGATPVGRCRHHFVAEQARIGRLRRVTRQTGIQAGADAIDIAPGPEPFTIVVLLGRGKPRGVHGLQLAFFLRQCLPRRAEVDQHRRAVEADVQIRRLDIEMQQFVRMDFAQAVHQLCKHPADEAFADACRDWPGYAAAGFCRARSASPCRRCRWRGRS